MPRTCIFCDNPLTGLRAEEHVIPRWLMEYLGVTDDQLYLAVANSQDDTIVKDRTHVAGNFVEGRVCGDCNNGWMNNLEKQTRELLKPLIEGTTNLLSISDDERTTLAKWARIRTTNRLVSSSTRGRPQDLRNFDPSNLLAMSFSVPGQQRIRCRRYTRPPRCRQRSSEWSRRNPYCPSGRVAGVPRS